MDPNVPRGAAILLDLIRVTETKRDGLAAYNTIYGHNEDKLAKPLTSMTVAEVLVAQRTWTDRFGSSATGAYQFMRATLLGLCKELGLRAGQIFDANLQDRLGYHLLLRRGYAKFMRGEIELNRFALGLSQEWASFPVLEETKGAKRVVQRGTAYHAGVGPNKALIGPGIVEATIAAALAAGNATPIPVPPPAPEKPVNLPPAIAPKNLITTKTVMFGLLSFLVSTPFGAKHLAGADIGMWADWLAGGWNMVVVPLVLPVLRSVTSAPVAGSAAERKVEAAVAAHVEEAVAFQPEQKPEWARNIEAAGDLASFINMPLGTLIKVVPKLVVMLDELMEKLPRSGPLAPSPGPAVQ